MLNWPKPHCIPFRELIVHPKAIPYLNTMHGRGWRLDHAPFILTSDYGTEGLVIHGSTNRHFDGSVLYLQKRANTMWHGSFTVSIDRRGGRRRRDYVSFLAAINLTSVVHRKFENGSKIMKLSIMFQPRLDMVIFNEALLHGTLPWKRKDRQRRSLLIRYSPKYLHFAGGYYDVTFPEWADELTEAQRSVLEPPYIYNRPLIEDNGEDVIRPLREG